VKNISLNAEATAKLTRVEHLARSLEPCRIVELVSVDPKHPGVGADVGLEHLMRDARVSRAHDVEVVVLASEVPKDLPRPVRREVIHGVDPVAERSDVADRLLDENVLVTDEHTADDLQD
jgi:hypothetical protein